MPAEHSKPQARSRKAPRNQPERLVFQRPISLSADVCVPALIEARHSDVLQCWLLMSDTLLSAQLCVRKLENLRPREAEKAA